MTNEDLQKLGVDHHFSSGIRTTEHGFQPVGTGVVLESLLKHYNVEVITGYDVDDIKPLSRGGFEINGKRQPPIYARYLINAAWDNNPHLKYLLKRHLPLQKKSPPPSDTKKVFIRCLALVDTSKCTLPQEDHSFFGLVGEHGGMVSFFNKRRASIFVPKNGLSYHGDYNLNENTVNELPHAARNKVTQLKLEKITVAHRILDDARKKYPFLAGAVPIDLYIQPVVSEDLDELCKRTHGPASWVRGVDGCLQICSMKATFAPFVALEALARFVNDHPELSSHFNEEQIIFLKRLIHSDMFVRGIIENAVLPDCFKFVTDDAFMSAVQFQAERRRYAFKRGLDFALFEEEQETASAGMNPSLQFNIIGKEENLREADLEHHTLTTALAESLFLLLKRTDIKLERVALGLLEEEVNDDEQDELGGNILKELKTDAHLKNLSMQGWNLTFFSRYQPLGALFPNLQEMQLKQVTLSLQCVRSLFEESSAVRLVKRLSIVQASPKKAVLKALLEGIQKCNELEFLDLSENEIRNALSDETSNKLQQLVAGSPTLKHLSLRYNNLFESEYVSSTHDLPLELAANPFLLELTRHPHLEKVDIYGNGPLSSVLQERLDSYFLSRMSS